MADKLEGIIEALLFTTDKPIPDNVLAEITETTKEKIKEAIDRINIRLRESGSAITIRQIAGGYEFLTLPEYAPYIRKFYKNRFLARLSKPAMEVLSIIAYKQPITKQEVEIIRGVNCDGVFHSLLERKLIKITGRKDSPGRPLIYGTTREFLQYLGINSLDELPKMEEVKNILEKEENIEKWEERVEDARTQTLFDFDNEGQSVSKRFEEEKSHIENVNEKEVDDMGKKKKWQEEYEELYGEKEEETYIRDEDYEIKDEEEEEEEKEEIKEEDGESEEDLEDEEYEEDEEDEDEEFYEEDFDDLEDEDEDEDEDE